MKSPDFLKMRCRNTEKPNCQMCNKTMIIPMHSIEMIGRDGNNAILMIKDTVIFPSCPKAGSENRFIETTMTWNALLDALDGSIVDIGYVRLTKYHEIE